MTQPKLTANAGAAEIRHAILRKMRALDKTTNNFAWRWAQLSEYIKKMAKRASSKPGGLGKR